MAGNGMALQATRDATKAFVNMVNIDAVIQGIYDITAQIEGIERIRNESVAHLRDADEAMQMAAIPLEVEAQVGKNETDRKLKLRQLMAASPEYKAAKSRWADIQSNIEMLDMEIRQLDRRIGNLRAVARMMAARLESLS